MSCRVILIDLDFKKTYNPKYLAVLTNFMVAVLHVLAIVLATAVSPKHIISVFFFYFYYHFY